MPSPVPLKTTNYSKKVWIHAPRHIIIIINTDGEEETGKPGMGRGHQVTGIYYNCSDHLVNSELGLFVNCHAMFNQF